VSHFDAAYSAILFRQRRYVIRRESRYAVKVLCATEVSLMETPELRCEDVFGDLPTFRAERLILRKAREEDVAGLFESASDPDVARYTSWEPHASVEVSRAVVGRWLQQYREGQLAP
jgi:hypothetical protein